MAWRWGLGRARHTGYRAWRGRGRRRLGAIQGMEGERGSGRGKRSARGLCRRARLVRHGTAMLAATGWLLAALLAARGLRCGCKPRRMAAAGGPAEIKAAAGAARRLRAGGCRRRAKRLPSAAMSARPRSKLPRQELARRELPDVAAARCSGCGCASSRLAAAGWLPLAGCGWLAAAGCRWQRRRTSGLLRQAAAGAALAVPTRSGLAELAAAGGSFQPSSSTASATSSASRSSRAAASSSAGVASAIAAPAGRRSRCAGCVAVWIALRVRIETWV